MLYCIFIITIVDAECEDKLETKKCEKRKADGKCQRNWVKENCQLTCDSCAPAPTGNYLLNFLVICFSL